MTAIAVGTDGACRDELLGAEVDCGQPKALCGRGIRSSETWLTSTFRRVPPLEH